MLSINYIGLHARLNISARFVSALKFVYFSHLLDLKTKSVEVLRIYTHLNKSYINILSQVKWFSFGNKMTNTLEMSTFLKYR